MEFLVLLTLLLIGAGAGYWLGYRQGVEAATADWSERMTRLEPPPRSAGQPTNVDGPPSRVSSPRIRQERRWGGDHPMHH